MSLQPAVELLEQAALQAGGGGAAEDGVDLNSPQKLADLLRLAPTPVESVLTGAELDQPTLVRIDPEEALAAYLEDNGLRMIGRRMSQTGMLELVATATPGIKELLVLGRLRQLERSEHVDLVIVDAPASGHALQLVRAPASMAGIARSGRLRSQADQALEMLGDPARTQVVLVTLPEHTPVQETVEAAFALEEEVGVALGPLVVNSCAPPSPPVRPPTSQIARGVPSSVCEVMDAALDEDHERHEAERALLTELRSRIGVPRLELPHVPTPSGGVDLAPLIDALDGAA